MTLVLPGTAPESATTDLPVVRDATAADAPSLQAIYAWHVVHGTGTFEETPPGIEAMAERWRAIADQGLPYLVLEHQGAILGYAYAGPFRPRSGYRFTVEDSIYLHPGALGRRLGRRLLGHLIERCVRLGLRQMVAVIGDAGNTRSIGLHAALGFLKVGQFYQVGFKFGRWCDVVFMQRALGDDPRAFAPDGLE